MFFSLPASIPSLSSIARVLAFTLACLLVGCGSRPAPPATAPAPEVVLQSETGPVALPELASKAKLTVLLFFTSECPVQKAHDLRMRELVALYEQKSVAFVAVVSEAGADIAAEREDGKRRLAIPILEDKNATLADALGVEYSTHSVLLDRDRRVLYSGAFDADRTHLTPNAERYLKEAIDASLAGRPVAKAKVEALGCPLKKH
jgi:hypothetical protein